MSFLLDTIPTTTTNCETVVDLNLQSDPEHQGAGENAAETKDTKAKEGSLKEDIPKVEADQAAGAKIDNIEDIVPPTTNQNGNNAVNYESMMEDPNEDGRCDCFVLHYAIWYLSNN